MLIRINEYVTGTYESVMLMSQLIDIVSDKQDVSDFINGKPENVFSNDWGPDL